MGIWGGIDLGGGLIEVKGVERESRGLRKEFEIFRVSGLEG